MIEPDLIQYVDNNNMHNICFLSQLRQEAYSIMQTMNYYKFQIDQAQIGVHRHQQQISDKLPTPQDLINNLNNNTPTLPKVDCPKIEVEDLSTPVKTEQNSLAPKTTTPLPAINVPTPVEPAKETPKMSQISNKVEQKTASSTSGGSTAPTPNVQVVKKAPVKKVNRSSKSLKKVKKRQPPQIRCGHPDKPHYSDGLCQKCYQKRFYQRKKMKM